MNPKFKTLIVYGHNQRLAHSILTARQIFKHNYRINPTIHHENKSQIKANIKVVKLRRRKDQI